MPGPLSKKVDFIRSSKKRCINVSSNFSTEKAKVGRDNSYSVKKVISSDSPLAKLEFKNPTCCFFRAQKMANNKFASS